MTHSMTQVQKERLRSLGQFVESVQPHRFCFAHIVDINFWKGHKDLSCGTTACALGWMTAMTMFQELGVFLSQGGSLWIFNNEIESKDLNEVCFYLFGLNEAEVEYLFIPRDQADTPDHLFLHRDATSTEVAQRILSFVENPVVPPLTGEFDEESDEEE